MPITNHFLPGYTAQKFLHASESIQRSQKSKNMGTLGSATVRVLKTTLNVIEIPFLIVEGIALGIINLIGAIFSKGCRTNIKHFANFLLGKKVNQRSLISVLEQYLEMKKPSKTGKIDGLCHGLTLLYGYYQFLGKEDVFFDRFKKCTKVKPEKIQSFEDKPFQQLPKELQELEWMYNDLRFLQEQSNKLIYRSMSESMKMVSDRPEIQNISSKLQFVSSFPYHEESESYDTLIKSLKAILTTDPQHPTFVTMGFFCHIVSIFCRDGKLYYYDSNNSQQLPPMSTKKMDLFLHAVVNDLESGYIKSPKNPFVLKINVLTNTESQDLFDQCKEKLNNNYLDFGGENRDQELQILINASKSGYTDVVTDLLKKGLDVNKAKPDEYSPLLLASQNGHIETVKILLENGAEINAKTKGFTPLIMACEHGHVEVVKLLLEKGGGINDVDKEGCTPLHIAALHGYTELTKALLERGSDTDATLPSGATPLQLASKKGHIEIVKLLQEKMAS